MGRIYRRKPTAVRVVAVSIPRLPLIEVQPRRLNRRLWELFALSAEGKATAAHKRELTALCNALEAGQDNEEQA